LLSAGSRGDQKLGKLVTKAGWQTRGTVGKKKGPSTRPRMRVKPNKEKKKKKTGRLPPHEASHTREGMTVKGAVNAGKGITEVT